MIEGILALQTTVRAFPLFRLYFEYVDCPLYTWYYQSISVPRKGMNASRRSICRLYMEGQAF